MKPHQIAIKSAKKSEKCKEPLNSQPGAAWRIKKPEGWKKRKDSPRRGGHPEGVRKPKGSQKRVQDDLRLTLLLFYQKQFKNGRIGVVQEQKPAGKGKRANAKGAREFADAGGPGFAY